MINKIGVGVIGLGVGIHHINTLLNNDKINLVGVYDFDNLVLKRFKNKFPKIKTFHNSERLIHDQNINFVVIASYDNFHFKHIKDCIKNKKNFFVEKPLCLNFREYNEIKKLLKKNPKIKFSSNFVLRNSPQFILLKKYIKENKLGKIYHLSGEYNFGRINKITKGWRGKIPFYSVSHGGGIHIIDIAIFLLNRYPKSCASYGNRICTKGTIYKYNDNITSILKFDNDLTMNVTSNYGCVIPHHHTLKIYGTKKTFIQEFGQCKIFNNRKKNDKPKIIDMNYKNKNKSYILNSFIESLVSNKKNILSKNEILWSMATSLYIEKSIKSKKWEKIKI